MKALLFAAVLTLSTLPALAQTVAPQTLFTNVHVFDGVNDKRMESASVLVEGKLIKKVSTTAIDAQAKLPFPTGCSLVASVKRPFHVNDLGTTH